MVMKFVCLASLLGLVGLGLVSCGTSGTNVNAGTGLLYVTTQGNESISVWGIDLDTGVISTNNNATATGNMPVAVVLAPTGSAAFVANKQDNTISSFTVNADGTLATGGNAVPAGPTPLGMGWRIRVENFCTWPDWAKRDLSAPGSISVYSITGNTLAEISGSPFSTEPPNSVGGAGPVSLAITPDGKYLYVANQFTNSVTMYAVNSGVLTLPGISYPVGISPSAVTLTPDGNILLVANSGSNSVSAFTACTSTTLTCITPDGHLTATPGSPFSAGLGPVAMATESDSQGEYLYVADYTSSQVSQYKVAMETGALTSVSPPTVSTKGQSFGRGGGRCGPTRYWLPAAPPTMFLLRTPPPEPSPASAMTRPPGFPGPGSEPKPQADDRMP